MTEPRRLQGHKGTATCCIASRQHPGLVVTSGEDGTVCWFDMRCKDSQLTMEVGDEPVTSLCFKPGNEDIIYVSMGKEIKCFDVHLGASWKPLESYNYNKEEINQIVCSSKSSFLAAADDGGDIKIIDIRQQCLYKTLRSGHSSICSSVQFLPWRPWEVITGGLDSKLVMWDFSKGRPNKIVDFSSPDMNSKRGSGGSQCFNPAFVHSVAVPDVDMLEKSDRICVVARGDGAIDVINVESELTAMKKSKNPTKPQKGGGGSHSSSRLKGGVSGSSSSDAETVNPAAASTKQRLHLDYSLGGHTAAVSCVAFSMFGERGRFIVSGGNDKSVKLWDWFKYVDQDQTISSSSSSNEILHLNINLKKKLNWLCTTPGDSENLVVCDTSKVVKVYSVS